MCLGSSSLALAAMIVMVLLRRCCDVVYKTDISQVNTRRPQRTNVHTHGRGSRHALYSHYLLLCPLSFCLYREFYTEHQTATWKNVFQERTKLSFQERLKLVTVWTYTLLKTQFSLLSEWMCINMCKRNSSDQWQDLPSRGNVVHRYFTSSAGGSDYVVRCK